MVSEGLQYPYDEMILASLGFLIFLITMGIYHMLELWVEHKTCPSLYPDSFLTRPVNFVPGFTYGIVAGIFMFFAQFSLSLGWHYDPDGRSVTYLMLAGVPPVTSALFFALFRDKLSAMQMIGMGIAVAGIVMLGVDRLDGTWISYFCGICSLFCFAARNVISRLMKNKGIDVYSGGIINSIGQVATGVVYLVFFLGAFDFSELFTMNLLFLECLIGVVLVAYGQYFIFGAVMTGNIPAVVTIINTNGVIFLILEYSFYGTSPSIRSLIACLIMIFGVVVLLFADSIIAELRSNKSVSPKLSLNN